MPPQKGKIAPPGVLVVFGASGDLTTRKLMPAVAGLAQKKLLSPNFAAVGIARTEMTDDEFRQKMRDACPHGGAEWDELTTRMRYVSGEYHKGETFDHLKRVLKELDDQHSVGPNRTLYLSIPPTLFEGVIGAIG